MVLRYSEFGEKMTKAYETMSILKELTEIIKQRRAATAEQSYTKSLLQAGTGKCARKMGEEALEVIIAALSEDDEAFKGECADLLYHYLVLLEQKNVTLKEIEAILADRMNMSGHAEKAARNED